MQKKWKDTDLTYKSAYAFGEQMYLNHQKLYTTGDHFGAMFVDFCKYALKRRVVKRLDPTLEKFAAFGVNDVAPVSECMRTFFNSYVRMGVVEGTPQKLMCGEDMDLQAMYSYEDIGGIDLDFDLTDYE